MQASSTEYWLRLGASADKLNIGLPFYGRSFTLRDPNNSGVGAPAIKGGGKPGQFTQEKGVLASYEVSLHHATITYYYYYSFYARHCPLSPSSAVVLNHISSHGVHEDTYFEGWTPSSHFRANAAWTAFDSQEN